MRPQGYSLTVLSSTDNWLCGRAYNRKASTRREIIVGADLKDVREQAKNVLESIRDGEHVWLGYQSTNTRYNHNQIKLYEAWTKKMGHVIQYKKAGQYPDGFMSEGECFRAVFPYIVAKPRGSEYRHHYHPALRIRKTSYEDDYVSETVIRNNLSVADKEDLCFLCGCDGVAGNTFEIFLYDYGDVDENAFCDFREHSSDYEEDVKDIYPFGVNCFKWRRNDQVIAYMRANFPR